MNKTDFCLRVVINKVRQMLLPQLMSAGTLSFLLTCTQWLAPCLAP